MQGGTQSAVIVSEEHHDPCTRWPRNRAYWFTTVCWVHASFLSRCCHKFRFV